MIQGLGYLLSQITDYEALTNLAQSGDRDTIDLKAYLYLQIELDL
jgi:type II pantothenate kinase